MPILYDIGTKYILLRCVQFTQFLVCAFVSVKVNFLHKNVSSLFPDQKKPIVTVFHLSYILPQKKKKKKTKKEKVNFLEKNVSSFSSQKKKAYCDSIPPFI